MIRLLIALMLMISAAAFAAEKKYYEYPNATSIPDNGRFLMYDPATGSKNLTGAKLFEGFRLYTAAQNDRDSAQDAAIAAGGGGHIIQSNGVPAAQEPILDFQGGFAVSPGSGKTVISAPVFTNATTHFIAGSAITLTANPATNSLTISSTAIPVTANRIVFLRSATGCAAGWQTAMSIEVAVYTAAGILANNIFCYGN